MTKDPGFYVRHVTRAQRFLLDLDHPGRPGLVVACGGIERCGPGYLVRRAGFPWWGLEIVLAGAGRLELAGEAHALVEGSVFTYGPGIAHAITSDARRPLLKAFIDLGGMGGRDVLRQSGLTPGTAHHVALTGLDRDLISLLVATGRAGGDSAPAVCASLAIALVQSLGPRAGAADQARDQSWQTWRRCRSWFEAQAQPPRDLAAFARGCGVAPGSLCRLFRRYDRISPMALVRRRRLLDAAQALANGMSIAAAATAAGYSDQFHFSRAFRQEFGQPPSQALRHHLAARSDPLSAR